MLLLWEKIRIDLYIWNGEKNQNKENSEFAFAPNDDAGPGMDQWFITEG